MKRGIKLFILFLLLTALFSPFITLAKVNDYNEYSKLKLDVNIKNSFYVTTTDPRIDFMSVNLSYFPRDSPVQKVEFLNKLSSPESKVQNYDEENVPFYWEKPQVKKFDYEIDSSVEVNNVMQIVDKKIKFPIEPVNTEYLKFTDLIDTNQDIRDKANEIAEGEDDLYVVSFKIAEWVEKNIKYDLNSLTANAVKKSSWVMANRDGVCDELTNLYISMLRSIGIPARFVSGTAYTNIGYKWGPHAWAEVYFPDKGWIPFDVTYKQFGWIDPSHVTLRTGVDSGNSSASFLWAGNNVDISIDAIDVNTALISADNKITTRLIDIRVKPLANNVGAGSYVPVEVILENNQPFYVPEKISVTKASKIEDSNVRTVLLRPLEKKSIYWIMKVDDNVDPMLIYTTTFEVEDTFHQTASANVSYSKGNQIFSKERALNLTIEKENSKIYNKDLKLKCTNSDYAYSYEEFKINCIVKNIGNVPMTSVKICLDSDCKKTKLGINEEANVNFALNNLEVGRRNIQVRATSDESESTYRFSFNVLKDPDLTVSEFSYPKEMEYNSNYRLSGLLMVSAPVKNIKLYLDNNLIGSVPEMNISKKFIINVKGSDIIKNNKFNLRVTFKDRNEHEYTVSNDYQTEVKNIPFFIKFLRWLVGPNAKAQ